VLGYGALNALLFVSYNRTEAFLNSLSVSAPPSGSGGATPDQGRGTNLLTTWLAGAVGGVATWVVSTPTELVKCRAQLQIPSPTLSPGPQPVAATASSWTITKHILRTTGVQGLYLGGTVTALRDSIGYGFYFWGYELCSRWMDAIFPPSNSQGEAGSSKEGAKVLLCGGLAGIITWASIFPLDVVKTRVQTQVLTTTASAHETGTGGTAMVGERTSLLGDGQRKTTRKRLGAWGVAKETYREGGLRPFFRGLAVCSMRAFIVNAVQWAVYEWIMMELGQGRMRRQEAVEVGLDSG
jgi:solute carrier family 25 carnitine/acylcarnitine transporter 20/29